MKKTWQKVLANEIQDSTSIRAEIRALTNAGQELEACLPGLEKDLEKARKALFAEVPGSLERVKQAEGAISESTGKIAAIASILSDLDAALKVALASEKTTRQEEIIREVGLIDEQVARIRLEIVEHFAKGAILYRSITGQEPSRLSYDFFLNHRIDDELQRRISEGSSDEVPLHRQRENLENEGIQLNKKSIS